MVGFTCLSDLEEANFLLDQGTEELQLHSPNEAPNSTHEQTSSAARTERAEERQDTVLVRVQVTPPSAPAWCPVYCTDLPKEKSVMNIIADRKSAQWYSAPRISISFPVYSGMNISPANRRTSHLSQGASLTAHSDLQSEPATYRGQLRPERRTPRA